MEETYQHSEAWEAVTGDDLKFAHTKIIVRSGQELRYGTISRRITNLTMVDTAGLALYPIPASHIWPDFSNEFTVAPEPTEGHFIKEPDFLPCGDSESTEYPSSLLLKEARIYELLRSNPHPNIARYLGCVVAGDRIRGLCLVKYKHSLAQVPVEELRFNASTILRGIEDGLKHLHSLGLVHGDLNERNVMMDGETPVIIDFDSCTRYGEELGDKLGDLGPGLEGLRTAEFKIDECPLTRMRTLIEG